MFEELTKRYSLAFEQQFHYACFYGYIRIKEQEIYKLKDWKELNEEQKDKDGYPRSLRNYLDKILGIKKTKIK